MQATNAGPSIRRKAPGPALLAGALLVGGLLAPAAAHASFILAFSQTGTANTVTGTAQGGSTTISGTNVAVVISALDQPGFTSANAFLTFDTTSQAPAILGTDGTTRQNYTGSFSIASGLGGSGTNYLSGTFSDLFQGFSASATLNASTPPASQVTFTSDVIPPGDLSPDRAVSFSFTSVTPGITGPNADGTIPSFTASVSGNFSANTTPVSVPEPMSLALLGTGLVSAGVLRRRR